MLLTAQPRQEQKAIKTKSVMDGRKLSSIDGDNADDNAAASGRSNLHGTARMVLPLSLPGGEGSGRAVGGHLHQQQLQQQQQLERNLQGSMMRWNSSFVPSGLPSRGMISSAAGTSFAAAYGTAVNEQQPQEQHQDVRPSGFPEGAVKRPEPNDVLLGRGKPFQLWKGNQQMLNLVDELRPKYDAVSRPEKGRYIDEVLRRVKADGGKFMERHVTSDDKPFWVEVSRSKAYYKVGHAFRSTSNRNRAARKVKSVHGAGDKTSDDTSIPTDDPSDVDTLESKDTKSQPTGGSPSTKSSKKLAKKMKKLSKLSSKQRKEGSASSQVMAETGDAMTIDQYRQSLLAQEERMHAERVNAILASAGTTSIPSSSSTSSIVPGGQVVSSGLLNRSTMLDELRQSKAMSRLVQSSSGLPAQQSLRLTPYLTSDELALELHRQQQHRIAASTGPGLSTFQSPSLLGSMPPSDLSRPSLLQYMGGPTTSMNPLMHEDAIARSSLLGSRLPSTNPAMMGMGMQHGFPTNMGLSSFPNTPSFNTMANQRIQTQLASNVLGSAGLESGRFFPHRSSGTNTKQATIATTKSKKESKDMLKTAGGVAPKKK